MPNIGGAMIVVFLLVAAFIIASYPIVKIIGWWIDGGVEPLAALVAIGLYVALAVSVVTAPSGFKIVLLALLLLSAVLLPVFGELSDRAGNRRIEDDRVQAYARALEENPMNPAARIALAEELYKRGDEPQAREHMQWTLQQFPKLEGRIRPVLERWDRDEQRRHAPQWIICHMCYAENEPNSVACSQCGAAFGMREGVEQRMWLDGGPKAIVRTWVVTCAAVLVGLSALMYLPAIVAGPIIAATVLVGAVIFMKWVGGTLGTA